MTESPNSSSQGSYKDLHPAQHIEKAEARTQHPTGYQIPAINTSHFTANSTFNKVSEEHFKGPRRL